MKFDRYSIPFSGKFFMKINITRLCHKVIEEKKVFPSNQAINIIVSVTKTALPIDNMSFWFPMRKKPAQFQHTGWIHSLVIYFGLTGRVLLVFRVHTRTETFFSKTPRKVESLPFLVVLKKIVDFQIEKFSKNVQLSFIEKFAKIHIYMTIMRSLRWNKSVILKLHRAWLAETTESSSKTHGPLEKFIHCQFPVDPVKKFLKNVKMVHLSFFYPKTLVSFRSFFTQTLVRFRSFFYPKL